MNLANIFPDVVAGAMLSPSAHNTQPARWRLSGDRIEIHADLSRRLPIGDPGDRDLKVSCGAAAEGTVLALAARGIGATVKSLGREDNDGLRAMAAVIPGGTPLPWDVELAGEVGIRTTHRLGFAATPAEDIEGLGEDCVTLITDAAAIGTIAKQIDRASAELLKYRALRSELLGWMRLDPEDSGYAIDGLNREVLGMSPGMARAARLVLGTGLYNAMAAIGLGPTLSGEASISAKAGAIALMHWPVDGSMLDAGRAFYRFWLKAAHRGLVGWPAAALADHSPTARALHDAYGLPENHLLYNALRLGRPLGETPSRTRLKPLDVMV